MDELLGKHMFIRAEDWTISTCEMGYYFDDTITFIEEQLGMKEHEDSFVLYGHIGLDQVRYILPYCVTHF